MAQLLIKGLLKALRDETIEKATLSTRCAFFFIGINQSADSFVATLWEAIFGGQEGPPDKKTLGASPVNAAATAKEAFNIEYVDHGGKDAFWKHLEAQRKKYRENPSSNREQTRASQHQDIPSKFYPFFCIMQSSGYGKSRLMDKIRQQINQEQASSRNEKDPTNTKPSRVVYLSFAFHQAFPLANVTIKETWESKSRDEVEQAFVRLFAEARVSEEQSEARVSEEQSSFELKEATEAAEETKEVKDSPVLFVVDEASQLLKRSSMENVDFFRCLRKATIQHVGNYSNDFFVLLSTYSSISHIKPAGYFDPSNKVGQKDEGETREAMEPFLFHQAIGVRNKDDEILSWTVEQCHEAKRLFAMGRPLWHAYLNASVPMQPRALLQFAQSKLLQGTDASLSSQRMLALLACRACLTISPISRFAPNLVSSHMGTAVEVSTTRDEVVVAYPSEPILAIASRYYPIVSGIGNFFGQAVSHLKEDFASGAVDKGHRGELIVRLLNLRAIDNCMSAATVRAPEAVVEVRLKKFLAQFDREGAKVSALLEVDGSSGYFDEGTVCFTHFVHMSRENKGSNPLITPNLLRCAYRRTAAIVVDAGRRGIDWIIPVRVGKEDKFVGLAGQDKNRLAETLEGLADFARLESHVKVTTDFFLTIQERALFAKAQFPLDWPAILFSLGTEEPGAKLAKEATRMRTR
eukprot:scaffold654_cov95-Cylindrotheca_fusiformis.AAC.1